MVLRRLSDGPAKVTESADVGDVAMADAFEVVPRLGAGGEGGSFPLPSSAVVETAKDSAMAELANPLPGPRQSTLEGTPPYSGPAPEGLDASGYFPLAVLMEKRVKDQLADVALLRSSVLRPAWAFAFSFFLCFAC